MYDASVVFTLAMCGVMGGREMAAYTQGEWCVDREDDRTFNINADTGRTWKAVAVVTANHLGQKECFIEEAEANARLIAAAPLAAELLVEVEKYCPPVVQDKIRAWKKAAGVK